MYNSNTSAYKTYANNSIQTATPKRLLIMLYEGAIKFCRLAEIGIHEGNMEAKNTNLIKVQNIVQELQITLNHDAGEIAGNLNTLYDYMNSRLLHANIHKDSSAVVEVRNMFEDLKLTWEKIN